MPEMLCNMCLVPEMLCNMCLEPEMSSTSSDKDNDNGHGNVNDNASDSGSGSELPSQAHVVSTPARGVMLYIIRICDTK